MAAKSDFDNFIRRSDNTKVHAEINDKTNTYNGIHKNNNTKVCMEANEILGTDNDTHKTTILKYSGCMYSRNLHMLSIFVYPTCIFDHIYSQSYSCFFS